MKTEKIKMEEDFSAIRKKWIKIGRKHLYRLFYGRMTMIALIMIAQVVVPLVLFYNLGVYSPLLYMGMLAVTFICILHIFILTFHKFFRRHRVIMRQQFIFILKEMIKTPIACIGLPADSPNRNLVISFFLQDFYCRLKDQIPRFPSIFR